MNLIEDIHHFFMECTAITDTRKKHHGITEAISRR